MYFVKNEIKMIKMEKIVKNNETFYLYSVEEHIFSKKCEKAVDEFKHMISKKD